MSRVEIQSELDRFSREIDGIEHENLTVRAWLYSPISVDCVVGNPLDDLLCVCVLRFLGINIDDLGDMSPEPVRIPATLDRVNVCGEWVYATSQRRDPSYAIPMIRRKRKHFHDSPYIQDAYVDTRSGKYRSYDLCTSCVSTPYVEWTVRGNDVWLGRLLPLAGSLGRDRNAGLGSVIGWEIEHTDRDPLIVDGVPQRCLPCLDGDLRPYAPGSCGLAMRTIRPPYVWRAGRVLCAVPIYPLTAAVPC